MKITILGCGGSSGVPRVGKSLQDRWGQCDPNNPKNWRRRASVFIEHPHANFLIDTSPDLRMQLLDNNISQVDAVLYTHDHGDHVHGIDDLRPLSFSQKSTIDIFGSAFDLQRIRSRFSYMFVGAAEAKSEGYPAFMNAHIVKDHFVYKNVPIHTFSQQHGHCESLGYRLGTFAYSTDVVDLSEEAFKALEGVETWVVDCMANEPRKTHAHLAQALKWIDRVQPKRAILTHMSNDLDYETLRKNLPEGVEPAYDGLTFTVSDA